MSANNNNSNNSLGITLNNNDNNSPEDIEVDTYKLSSPRIYELYLTRQRSSEPVADSFSSSGSGDENQNNDEGDGPEEPREGEDVRRRHRHRIRTRGRPSGHSTSPTRRSLSPNISQSSFNAPNMPLGSSSSPGPRRPVEEFEGEGRGDDGGEEGKLSLNQQRARLGSVSRSISAMHEDLEHLYERQESEKIERTFGSASSEKKKFFKAQLPNESNPIDTSKLPIGSNVHDGFILKNEAHPATFKSRMSEDLVNATEGRLRNRVAEDRLQELCILEFMFDGTYEYKDMRRNDLSNYVKQAIDNLLKKEIELIEKMSQDSRLTDKTVGFRFKRNLIHARDIRKLDGGMSESHDPSIVVRRHVILINFDHARAIVLHDRILLIVPPGADAILEICLERLEKPTIEFHLGPQFGDVSPFEYRALEAVLETVVALLRKELAELKNEIYPILASISKTSYSTKDLENFKNSKGSLNSFRARVDGVFRALNAVLDEDEDMAFVNLTALAQDPLYFEHVDLELNELVEEAELLFEVYTQEVIKIRTQATLLEQKIENTQNVAHLKMNVARNQLMLISTLFSLIATCLALATVVSGFFGMNTFDHPNDSWFAIIVSSTMGGISLIFILTGIYLRYKGIWVT